MIPSAVPMLSLVDSATELKVTTQISPRNAAPAHANMPKAPKAMAQNRQRPAVEFAGPLRGVSPLRRRASTAKEKVIGPPRTSR